VTVGASLQRHPLDQVVAREHDPARVQRDVPREPVEPLGISPFEAISRVAARSREPEATCSLPDVLGWSPAQLGEARETVEALDRRLARVGDPATHFWRGAGLTEAGLERIPTRDEVFDPERHEALATQPVEPERSGKVIDELVPGFTFRGKLVRPARVTVGVDEQGDASSPA